MSVLVEQLIAYLRAEGIAVSIANTRPHLPLGSERWLVARYLGFTLKGMRAMAAADVLHVHARSDWGFWGPMSWPRLWGKRKGKRLVVTFQGGDGRRFFAQSARARRWLRSADAIMVASKFLQDVLAAHGFQARLIPNIVDLSRFPYMPRPATRPWLVVARHLHPIYNIECVLRAFHLLQDEYDDARLFITGIGPSEASLKALAAQLSLRNVVFTGKVPDVRDVYSQAHIFVNASHIDNSPVAVVEAMSWGLNMVATSVGDLPNMIDHGRTGLLVAPDDHVGIAASVRRLVADPECALRMRSQAQKESMKYTWAAQRDAVLEVYGLPARSAP